MYVMYYAAYHDSKISDYLAKLNVIPDGILTDYYLLIRTYAPLIQIDGTIEDNLFALVASQGADNSFSQLFLQSAERFQRKYDYCTAAEYNIRIPARFFPHDEALMEQSFAKIRGVLADWDWSKLDLRTLMILTPEAEPDS